MGEIILGIHSNVAGDEQGFIAGHAWLSVTEAGKTTTYGLWPDEHRWIQQQGLSNGDASDIRIGLERNSNAIASRYYINPANKYSLHHL